MFASYLSGSKKLSLGQVVHPNTSSYIEEICNTEAYAYPFKNGAYIFAESLRSSGDRLASIDIEPKAYNGLISWYVKRQIEVARFVFHLSYMGAGGSYSSWCEGFDCTDNYDNTWLELAEEFPVLIRLLESTHDNCIAAVTEMLNRLSDDRPAIQKCFGIASNSSIAHIHYGLSDPHRGGRSVAKVVFSDKNSLIYKPKPVQIDSELYSLKPAYLDILGIMPLKIISRDEYGWVQDIAQLQNTQVLEPKSIPEIIGASGAFFWLINATDLHSENVLVGKKCIYALDLETLLNSTDAPFSNDSQWRSQSVYTTGLFSFRFGENAKINISGFDPSQNFGRIAPSINFSLVNEKIELNSSAPSPDKPSAQDFILNFGNEGVDRVTTAFSFAANNEVRKYAQDFVKSIDDRAITRVVFRDTIFYSRFLELLTQPRFLRDGALFDLELMSLFIGISGRAEKSSDWISVVESEIEQLRQADIPYFFKLSGKKDLFSEAHVVHRFFSVSGKDLALEKINSIEDSDIEEQVELIRIALKRNQFKDRASTANFKKPVPSDRSFKKNFNLEFEILRLGETIIESSFQPSGCPARWISMHGDVFSNESQLFVGDNGFFSGAIGILTAIQAAASVCLSGGKSQRLEDFLDQQSLLWEKSIKHRAEDSNMLLGFSGLGGEIFGYSVLYMLDPKRWFFLLERIEQLVKSLDSSIQNDSWLDVISGSSGLILGCNQLLKSNISTGLRKSIIDLQEGSAKKLLSLVIRQEEGLSWYVPGYSVPLMGYAHGWAGIVAALGCVRRNTQDELLKHRIGKCLADSLEYPDYILRKKGKWMDYRFGQETNVPLNESWCNGHPGIVRGLLEVRDLLSVNLEAQLERYIVDIHQSIGELHEFRYCCGEMGNIDLFIDISKFSGIDIKPHKKLLLDSAFNILLRTSKDNKFFSPELTFPSLFHGQAGILYTASRLLNAKLPSLSGQIIDK